MPALTRLRTRLVAALHLALFCAAQFLAYGIRFDFDVPDDYWALCLGTLPFAICVKFVLFYVFAQFKSWLRYASLEDLKSILVASTAAELLVVAFDRFMPLAQHIPRSIFLLDWGLTVALVSGARLIPRMLRESGWPVRRSGGKSIFIVGAGDAAEGLLRELRSHPELKYLVAGFLDDDPRKQGARIGGVPVLGAIDRAADLAEAHDVHEAIIAIPSASGEVMRRIVESLRKAEIAFKTLPGLPQLVGGKVDVKQIRNVGIEELLGRESVELDVEALGTFFGGKTVAVTGAAGSIGSEVCRQILGFSPDKLVMIDRWENGLFTIGSELKTRPVGTDVVPCIADVTDRRRIEQIFVSHRPAVVFQAAAHKHVPLTEHNPCEAVKNNVSGTRVVADLSVDHGVEAFVLISTDKAASPRGVMGMTKRVAELYVHALGHERGANLVAVRFGNVLGSAGSVVPTFREQIEHGGPVTVTHPDMTRFFMTIPEAVQLVLQAAAIGKPGEILVLDMGEPVRIVDLARELIELSGLREPEDIRIEFTGVRPGEKMHEELSGPDEELVPSSHEKVSVALSPFPDLGDLTRRLAVLEEAAARGDEDEVRRLLAVLTAPGAVAAAFRP